MQCYIILHGHWNQYSWSGYGWIIFSADLPNSVLFMLILHDPSRFVHLEITGFHATTDNPQQQTPMI